MAENKNLSKQVGLTPKKAALMGVLGIALVAVLYRQFGGSGGGSDSPLESFESPRRPVVARPAITPVAQTAAVNGAAEAADAAALEFDQSKWTSPELVALVSHDPFALPSAFPQPPMTSQQLMAEGGTDAVATASAEHLADELERLQMQLDELKNRGVQVIMNVDGQYVAMIGDRLVHVGDEINDFTVTEIDPTGVRVERKHQP
jgi:hypothetical protein